MKHFRTYKLFSILLLLALLFSCTACNAGEKVLITCNGFSVTESTFKLLMTEKAMELWDTGTVTKEELVEKAKEATLAYLPAYTYYVQGYQEATYTLSEEASTDLRVSILSGLLDSGLEYENYNRDKVFLETFGATFEQYMSYHEQVYLISYFYQEELSKIKVDETLSKNYFEENREEYAICTADILRYPNDEEGKAAASLAEQQLLAGTTLEDCKQYKGWDKAETLTFDSSSNLDKSFGDGFTASMLVLNKGEVKTLETDAAITVARINQLAGYAENLKEIQEVLKGDLYAEQLAEILKDEKYKPEIVNQKAYDAITTLPGNHLV